MEETIYKWIETGQVDQSQILPLFLEYDRLYNDGTLPPAVLLQFFQSVTLPWDMVITQILKKIASKYNIPYVEVYDKNGRFLRRFKG